MHYKNAKKFEEKKALIHLSPFSMKHISYFCDSWPLCVFSALCNLPRKKISIVSLRINFEKHFSQFSIFEVFCKWNKFTESWGWLLLIIWNWRGFLLIVEIASCQYFRLRASFRNFHLVKEYPLAFRADLDLRKVVLRAETCFVIIELYRKNLKINFFCHSCWGKSGFLVSGVFLEVIFDTEKMAKTWIRSFANLGKLSDPGLLYNWT